MSYGIKDEFLNEIIRIISTNDKTREIILFGSRAKGNPEPGSDIDLALKGTDITLDDLISMKLELGEIPIANKIDLVIFDQIKEPALTDHINRVGIKLFVREGRDG
jgi:predicted nucleotidyltransferase